VLTAITIALITPAITATNNSTTHVILLVSIVADLKHCVCRYHENTANHA